jgi:hypothetical protein
MPISLEPVSQSGPQIASRSWQRQRNLTKNSSAGSSLRRSGTPIEFSVRSPDQTPSSALRR